MTDNSEGAKSYADQAARCVRLANALMREDDPMKKMLLDMAAEFEVLSAQAGEPAEHEDGSMQLSAAPPTVEE